MSFGRRIRSIRLRQKLTREQVCSLLACPLGFYIDLEEGKTDPCDDTVEDFVNLYGLDRNFLLGSSSKGRTKVAHIKKLD